MAPKMDQFYRSTMAIYKVSTWAGPAALGHKVGHPCIREGESWPAGLSYGYGLGTPRGCWSPHLQAGVYPVPQKMTGTAPYRSPQKPPLG